MRKITNTAGNFFYDESDPDCILMIHPFENGRGVAFVQCIDTGAQSEHRFVRRYWGPWDQTQPDESIRAILDNGPKWPDLPAPPDNYMA